jgi:hypothetical protein
MKRRRTSLHIKELLEVRRLPAASPALVRVMKVRRPRVETARHRRILGLTKLLPTSSIVAKQPGFLARTHSDFHTI